MLVMTGWLHSVPGAHTFDTVSVPSHTVNQGSSQRGGCTRRQVLRAAAAGGVGALLNVQGVSADDQPASAPAGSTPWWMQIGGGRSRVVDVRDAEVVRGDSVDESLLEQLLARGVRALTDETTASAGWRKALGAAQSILVKFNRVGADAIRTTEPFARVLVNSLEEAGYDRNRITMAEVPARSCRVLGVRQPIAGWADGVRAGENFEPIAAYWAQADAVINVPFLKTHRIAGMSGCMKNLSHALVQRPALYHDNACSPYVGQVVGSKLVSSKLRINVLNALRVVVRDGPEATLASLATHGGLLLGYDPVAVDTVGLALLAGHRRNLGIEGDIRVPYLEAADADLVGRGRGDRLDQIVLMEGG
jgi:hypothetical protein